MHRFLVLVVLLLTLSACRESTMLKSPEFRVDETGGHIYAELSAAPYGQAVFIMEVEDEAQKELFLAESAEICRAWPSEWPKYRKLIETMLKDYDKPNLLKNDQIMVSVVRVTPGYYMADRAKHLLSFSLDDSGQSWDIFISGVKIVHHQPVL